METREKAMKSTKIKTLVAGAVIVVGLALPVTALADSTGNHGQPSQSCQSFFSGALTPQGFNTAGFQHATTVYAGAQPQNSGNPKSIAQYDVACFQAASHQGAVTK
jgi:hypothetical protein